MTTTAPTTTAPTAQQQQQGAATAAAQSLTGDFNTFLTLLTTQLQNQDPLQPLDSSQFTQQLVAMTGVQQTIATNQNLEQLLALTQSSQSANVVNYLGKTITANGNTTSLAGGQANWQYALPKDAANVTLTIMDAKGNTMLKTAGNPAHGAHGFAWNGTMTNGLKAADGIYTLSVAATDSAGAQVTVNTQITGPVGSIEADSGQQFLVVGANKVRVTDVVSVNNGASATNTASASPSLVSSLVNALTGNTGTTGNTPPASN
jgi:flagellar basal-body rod modification protein FlgD